MPSAEFAHTVYRLSFIKILKLNIKFYFNSQET